MFNLKNVKDQAEKIGMMMEDLEVILKSTELTKKLDEKFTRLEKEDIVAADNFLSAIEATMMGYAKKGTKDSAAIARELSAWIKPKIYEFYKSDRAELLKAELWIGVVEELMRRKGQ